MIEDETGLKININEKKFFEKGFKENYGFWMKLGGMFFGSGSAVISVVFLLNASFIELAFLETTRRMLNVNLTIAIENFHFALFVLSEIVAIITFLFKRTTLVCLYTTIGRGFYDYEGTLDEDCLKLEQREKEKTKKMKPLLHITFVTIVMSACVAISILRPALIFYSGEHTAGPSDDGVVRLAPVPMWTPFENTKWYALLLANISQYILSYITPGIVFGSTFFFALSCEELRIQLIILGQSLKNVIKRAECLDMPTDEAIRLCLKHSVRHHQMLYEFKGGVESVTSVPGFCVVLGFTVMMGICGFMFVSNEVSFVTKMVFCLFLLSECLMFYVFCHFGEEIQQLSEDIGEKLYESDWINHGDVMRKYMLIIQSRSRQKMVIRYGGLIVLSKETFSALIRTSYSYFNLMLEFN